LPLIYASKSDLSLLEPKSYAIKKYIATLQTEFNLETEIEIVNLNEDMYNINFLN